LDPKVKRCYFIGYGSDMYDYRFRDTKTRKLLESRNVTFNENMFYKDRTAESVNENKQPEQVSLQEISKSDVVNRRQNIEIEFVPERESKPEQIVESATRQILIRRSSRTIIAPQRYSPSLHYLLLIDVGEP